MASQTSRLTIAIDTARAKKNTDSLTTSLNRNTKAGNEASTIAQKTAKSYKKIAVAAASAWASIGFGRRAITDLARIQDVNSRLIASTDDLAAVQQFLSDTVAETSAVYIDLADSYSKLLPLQKGGLLTMTQLEKVTLGMANASAALGVSQQDVNLALRGLVQVVSTGGARTDTQDFNQVFENLGGVLIEVEKAAGLASGGLRRLVKSTEGISGIDLTTKFIEGLDAFEGRAAALADNITQTFNRTRNAYTEVVKAFEEPLSDIATTSAQALTTALEAVADNADEIIFAMELVGSAVALNVGSKALTSMTAYGASLLEAAQKALFFANAEKQAAIVGEANAAAKLKQLTTQKAAAASKLEEIKLQALSIKGTQKEFFEKTALAGAEEKLAVATTKAAAAKKAATVATTRLDIATRRATLSTQAATFAAKGAAGAYALIGGPTGAVIAAGALSYYALKASDATKAVNAVARATRDLNAEYSAVGVKALTASEAARDVLQKEINKLLEYQARLAAGLIDQPPLGTRDDQAAIRNVQRQIDFFKESLDKLEFKEDLIKNAKATSDEFESLFRYTITTSDDVVRSLSDIQAEYAKLFPRDQKLANLRELREAVKVLRDDGEIDTDLFKKYTGDINDAIRALQKLQFEQSTAGQFAKELADTLDARSGDVFKDYREDIELFNRALVQSPSKVEAINVALAGLDREVRLEFTTVEGDTQEALNKNYQTQIAALEEFHKLRQTSTEQANADLIKLENAYTDQREELNRRVRDTLADIVDVSDVVRIKFEYDDNQNELYDLQRDGELSKARYYEALTQLDKNYAQSLEDIRKDVTIFDAGENITENRRNYAIQLAELDEFHRITKASDEQANADRLKLAQSYGDAVVAENVEIMRALADIAGDDRAGIQLEIEYITKTTDLEKRLRNDEISLEQYRKTKEGLEQTHQDRLTEIVRSGEGTRTQIEAASTSDRIAAFINSNAQELQIAQNFVDEVTGFLSSRAQIEADLARSAADRDQRDLKEAERAYKKSATEQNRIALEAAKEKAAISEAAARREFENQKKYAIAQAFIAQGLTIAQTFASNLDPLSKFAVAAASALQVAAAIRQIKSTEFDGGSAAGGVRGSYGGGTSSYRADDNISTTQGREQTTIINVINTGFLGFTDTDDVISDSVKRLNENGLLADKDGNPLDTSNIQTREYTIQ